MIARKYVLRGKSNFERVEKEGKIIQSTSFGLSYFDRKDKNDPQFGFIVSKKISPEAVQRNRVERAMSEAARYIVNHVKPGYDIVFLAKQESLRKSTDFIMKEVNEILRKAGLIKSE